MKKTFYLLFIVLTLSVLAACGGGNNGKKTENGNADGGTKTFKMTAATTSNEVHSSYQGLLRFKELIEEKTDGGIEVELFHSGQVGDDREMTEATQLGTLDMAVVSVGNVTPFIKEVGVLEFPFLFPNEEVAYEVLDGEVGQNLLEKFPEKNMIGLAYWENGFRNVTNDKAPLETVADFKGMKIRTMDSDLHIDVFKALGANPTPMSFTELYTGLQQGTVDGQENPNPLIDQQKFFEVQKYLSNSRHVYSPYLLIMSKQFFDGIPEEYQALVKEVALEAGIHQREVNQEQDAASFDNIIEEGMEFTEITEEVRAEIAEIVQPVIDKYSDKAGADFVKELYDAVEEASK